MRTRIVAFLLGNISFLYWPNDASLADYFPERGSLLEFIVILLASVLILLVSLYKSKRMNVSSLSTIFKIFLKNKILPVFIWFFKFSVFALAGALLTSFYIQQAELVLDLEQWEGKTMTVKGYIDSIPHKTSRKQSFEFMLTAKEGKDKRWDDSFRGKIKLSWYRHYERLESGQQWQLKVRLKKPNGFLNGGFDYEKYLYQHRIVATGYVREGKPLAASEQLQIGIIKRLVSNVRQSVAVKLDKILFDYPYKGLIKALTLGLKKDINPEQWQVFLRTGTSHLIAISGLHIGLMSSLVWFLVFTLWRSCQTLNQKIPATIVASSLALLAALFYAALAGFAIPTQRALIMLSVVFMAMMLKREFPPSYILLLAALAVVIFDPLSPLSPGFWLSFGAVAVILLIVSSRLSIKTKKIDKLRQFGWLQFAIFIGLFPPLLMLFNQFSLISPLANLIAVPVMSLFIVPVTLIATGLIFVFEPLALVIFTALEWSMDGLFVFLSFLSQWSESLVNLSQQSLPILLMVLLGSLWLLMPSGWHGRWLGLFLLLPALFMEAEKIPQGEVHLTMLDVGQGLAMIVRTRHHKLIYDTGDKFSARFNMADSVIIPYMKLQGIANIDTLIVSHSDRDHAGSFEELVKQVTIKRVLSGEQQLLSEKLASFTDKNENNSNKLMLDISQCKSGEQWQWDGVHFEILSPTKPLSGIKANNRSCVLYIRTASNLSLLLTGDIEKKSEKQLLKNYPNLKVDVLQVPHHGSKTSSSMAFLKQLEPDIALFSFGYRNRFRHPSQTVLKRYKQLQIKLYNTGNGAIEISSNITNNSFSVKEYRVENQRRWHREIKAL